MKKEHSDTHVLKLFDHLLCVLFIIVIFLPNGGTTNPALENGRSVPIANENHGIFRYPFRVRKSFFSCYGNLFLIDVLCITRCCNKKKCHANIERQAVTE